MRGFRAAPRARRVGKEATGIFVIASWPISISRPSTHNENPLQALVWPSVQNEPFSLIPDKWKGRSDGVLGSNFDACQRRVSLAGLNDHDVHPIARLV
jgi:hypothetical protein